MREGPRRPRIRGSGCQSLGVPVAVRWRVAVDLAGIGNREAVGGRPGVVVFVVHRRRGGGEQICRGVAGEMPWEAGGT
jgi:hypothetical protein